MVQWQLCTLEHLMTSGFGRPFPRHGLQLLFWFANHCVTCDLVDLVVVMKMAYFEVGNLNTETYPASANLPTYVRENYGLDGNRGNYNIDRIIISHQVRTRVVETVYVTEHDTAVMGRFCPDRTYEVSCELIRALQNPQLDLTTFLTRMDYYGDIEVFQASDMEEIHYPDPSGQPLYNIVQAYSGSTATREQNDNFRFFSEGFNQQINVNIEPFSYDQQGHYIVNVTSHNSGLTVEVPLKYRKPKAKKRQRALWQSYSQSEWVQAYKDFAEESKKRRGGGGVRFVHILLGAGALFLAAKCFSWLRSCWKTDLSEHLLKNIPWSTPSYQRTHIMLDYVY